MMHREQRLRAALTQAFAPIALEVTDDSAHHAGHAGATAAGETHYSVRIVSAVFAGMSRVARYRAVHAALAAEFDAGMHALSLDLRSLEEQQHPPNTRIVSKSFQIRLMTVVFRRPVG